MTVIAKKAVVFSCEKCNHTQYEEHFLVEGWHEDRAVMEDMIICEKCGHDNHVIEEL